LLRVRQVVQCAQIEFDNVETERLVAGHRTNGERLASGVIAAVSALVAVGFPMIAIAAVTFWRDNVDNPLLILIVVVAAPAAALQFGSSALLLRDAAGTTPAVIEVTQNGLVLHDSPAFTGPVHVPREMIDKVEPVESARARRRVARDTGASMIDCRLVPANIAIHLVAPMDFPNARTANRWARRVIPCWLTRNDRPSQILLFASDDPAALEKLARRGPMPRSRDTLGS
jgi:hypothetical protein